MRIDTGVDLALANALIKRLNEEISLLMLYGDAKFGDEWWPGNAGPWIGVSNAHQLHILGYDQGEEHLKECPENHS